MGSIPSHMIFAASPSSGFLELFYSRFGGADNLDLANYVPEVGSWSAASTSLHLLSNALDSTGAPGVAYASGGANSVATFSRAAGVSFSFDVQPDQTAAEGLAIGMLGSTSEAPGGGHGGALMWFYSDANIYCREGGTEGAAATYTTDLRHCLIQLKDTGATYFYNGTQIADLAVGDTDLFYVSLGILGGGWTIDNIRLTSDTQAA